MIVVCGCSICWYCWLFCLLIFSGNYLVYLCYVWFCLLGITGFDYVWVFVLVVVGAVCCVIWCALVCLLWFVSLVDFCGLIAMGLVVLIWFTSLICGLLVVMFGFMLFMVLFTAFDFVLLDCLRFVYLFSGRLLVFGYLRLRWLFSCTVSLLRIFLLLWVWVFVLVGSWVLGSVSFTWIGDFDFVDCLWLIVLRTAVWLNTGCLVCWFWWYSLFSWFVALFLFACFVCLVR